MILKIYLSPEIDGSWEFKNYLSGINTSYKKSAIFFPDESFYPDTKIIVYTVGLKRLFPGGFPHEQSLEFFSSKIPKLKA
ncbi:MAG: hypothetical protein GF349_03690 [Candidatus Magasanikbacteria bacterium]|nr:hypothetical protein [Candidatus Magasanikbacteria bacterium]